MELHKTKVDFIKKGTYFEKRALAKAKRIRQPPENVLVAAFCIADVKPNPSSMTEALAGALSDSMF